MKNIKLTGLDLRVVRVVRGFGPGLWRQSGRSLPGCLREGRPLTKRCIGSIEMKRINTTTNTHFRRGDVREDGMVFFAYTNRKKRDGHFVEIWLQPEASQRATDRDRLRHRQKANGRSRRDTGTNP